MSQFTQVHTERKYRLLTRKKDVAGNEYIYLKGVASTAAGSWVVFDEAGVTALIDTDVAATTSAGGFVAVATAAVDAATSFGWYLIYGSGSASAATVTDNGEVFPTATAGQCDDTGTGGLQVVGAKWRSANASGLATVQVSYPLIGVDVA
jgi:hypothetical protein